MVRPQNWAVEVLREEDTFRKNMGIVEDFAWKKDLQRFRMCSSLFSFFFIFSFFCFLNFVPNLFLFFHFSLFCIFFFFFQSSEQTPKPEQNRREALFVK